MLSSGKMGKQELSWVGKGLLGEGRKKERGIERLIHIAGGSSKDTTMEQNEERYKMLVEPGKEGIIQWMSKKEGKV